MEVAEKALSATAPLRSRLGKGRSLLRAARVSKRFSNFFRNLYSLNEPVHG
jgi:hypothetical protein